MLTRLGGNCRASIRVVTRVPYHYRSLDSSSEGTTRDKGAQDGMGRACKLGAITDQ